VTLGDADFRKSLMKMIYRKFPKTASLPVACHPFRTYGISLSEWDGEKLKLFMLAAICRCLAVLAAVHLTSCRRQ
jgi:hypothetical protein